MKIIFRGGFNIINYDSLRNNILFEHGNNLCRELEIGKKVLIITAAKPDGEYSRMIRPLTARGAIEINQSFTGSIDWSYYDWVIVMGGDNTPLLDKMKTLDFSLEKMKDSAVYIGDSAGCMIQSAFYYEYDKQNKDITFHKGLLPNVRKIFIVHADNSYYVDDFVRDEVKAFAEKENLDIIEINENQDFVFQG